MAILQHKPNRAEDALTAMHRTIAKMAHKYARNHRNRDFDDLYMDGVEGLMKAYHSFDATKGRAFSSHAYQWIWAHISDRAQNKWADYNNTSGTAYEDHNLGSYTPETVDEVIDAKRKLERLDSMTRGIVRARAEGYTFQQIADAATSMGYPSTLHQIRNRYNDAIKG